MINEETLALVKPGAWLINVARGRLVDDRALLRALRDGGLGGAVLDAFREEMTATLPGKLGGLLIRPAARRLRTRLDPDTYGGGYLLGLRGLAVVAHGNSSACAVANVRPTWIDSPSQRTVPVAAVIARRKFTCNSMVV